MIHLINKKISKILCWILLAPAILPLIYIDGLLYPYVTPKALLLRGLGIIAIAIFSYLALSGQSFYWGRLRQKISWMPGILLVVSYITSWLGVDFFHSFWSTFDRGDGLLTLSIVMVFFYLVLLFADLKFFSKLLKIVALAGTFVAVYAFLQWLQLSTDFSIPFIEDPRGRLGGTFGSAAFLAGYLGMTVFATLASAKEYGKKWSKFMYLAAILQVSVIFLTATRGTILALLFTGLMALIYFAFKKGKYRLKNLARISLAVLVIFIGVFFMFRTQLSKSSFEPVRRIASISAEDSTVSSRLFVWEKVFKEAIKSPIIGYGAENINILFNRAYDPDEITEQWFDRSHNAFLDYFVQYGIVGFLLYLGIIFSLGFAGWKMWGSGDKRGIYIIGMATTYAIQNFFVFDTAMTLWTLFVFLAVALVVSSNENSSPLPLFPHSLLVGGGLATILLLLLVPVVINPMRANLLLAKGYLHHMADVPQAVDLMNQGLALGTYADLEYGYQAYVMYAERQSQQLSGDDRVVAYNYALETLTKNLNRYSYDARTATYLAHVIDLAPPEVERDSKLLLRAVKQATELSPKRTQPWLINANIFIRKGDALGGVEKINAYKKAISVLEEYTRRVTKNAESRYVLANLNLIIGDNESAARWAREGSDLYAGSIKTARRAVRYYISLEDWDNALRFLEDVTREDKADYESAYDLAKLYYLTGNNEMSLKIFERLEQEKPELVKTDPEFIKAIQIIKGSSL